MRRFSITNHFPYTIPSIIKSGARDIYSGHSPPPWKEDLKKGKEKGGKEEKKEKSDKTHVEIPL